MAKTSQKSQDFQAKWEDRISKAKKVRKEWKELFRVDLAKDYFDGKQNPGYPAEEWITINKLYSHLKSQLPALYNADPYFYVKLRKSYSPNPMEIALWEKRGKIRQSYLNYLKEELELKPKARLAVQDAHFAYGVIKVYLHADRVKNPDYGKTITGEEGYPLWDEKGLPLLEPEIIPVNEKYCISRIHPDDFLWDEDAGTLEENWNWVAQCIRMTLAEAKKDGRFNKAAIKALKANGEADEDRKRRDERKKGGDIASRGDSGSKPHKWTDEKEEDKIIYVWEIYDLKNDKWSMIAEGGEIPLIEDEELPPGVEKHPFSVLRFTLRDDSPYPIPPLSQGIDPQKEYNLSRSRLLTHRKRFNRKYEVDISVLEDPDKELSKLESGDDGTIIKKRGAMPAVTPIQDASLDQMGIHEIMLLNTDMIELFGGSSDENRGIASADTATQAGILDKRLEMKEGDALSNVVDFTCVIGRKLDQLVQANITQEEAVKVTGPEGEFWSLVRNQDYEAIKGEYEYSVNVGATIPRMPQMERTQWMAFLALLANFPQLLLQKHLMKRMAEMHHIEDEAMIEELYQLGRMMMSGQMPMPGKTGSTPGGGEMKPASVVGGQAGGPSSLLLPGAGNFQG